MREHVGERPCRRCNGTSCACARRDTSASSSRSGREQPRAGRPLDQTTRSSFEPRFRFDFSTVRIFDDGAAHRRAAALGAAAFTTGREIGFGAGEYAPDTPAGRRLLAHELAHVVQQSAGTSSASASGDAAEVEADAAAAAVSAGREVPRLSAQPAGGLQLQRGKRHHADTPRIAPVKFRSEPTDVITDLHPAGSLDAAQWQAAYQRGDYEALYADAAKVAQADLVIDTSSITKVADAQHGGLAPGLNLATDKNPQHPGTTAFVDGAGNFGVPATLEPGKPQVGVAIVLHPDAFTSKEVALMTLRHEMEHAEHLQAALDLIEKWRTSGGHATAPRSRRGARAASPRTLAEDAFERWLRGRHKVSEVERVLTTEASRGSSRANTEVLAPIEGFMSVFHLIDPTSTKAQPVFGELLGAAGDAHEGKWLFADPSVRAEGLGRLREYYCHTLDRAHRELFAGLVYSEIQKNNGTRFSLGETLGAGDEIPDDALQTFPEEPTTDEGRKLRAAQIMAADAAADFLKGLQAIVDEKCASILLPMK